MSSKTLGSDGEEIARPTSSQPALRTTGRWLGRKWGARPCCLPVSPESGSTGLRLSQGEKAASPLGKWGEADFLENREIFKLVSQRVPG